MSVINPTVQQYVQARARLHQEVVSGNLVGNGASEADGHITLTRDVVSKTANDTVTYKAGSSYSRNPYATRANQEEKLTWASSTGESVTIAHEYKPHAFYTVEALDVQTRQSGPTGFSSSGSRVERLRVGWHPQGWVQKEVKAENGFVLG